MQTFYIKQHDTSPSLRAFLKNPDGSAMVLTEASVCFNMLSSSGEVVVSRGDVRVIDELLGEVQYDWQVTDTDAPGLCQAEFEVTFSNGRVETIPNHESLAISIAPDLG